MREVLDRLREAETALDNELAAIYHKQHLADRIRAIELLWRAKKNLWWATMQTFDAFAGVQTPVPTASKPATFAEAAAAYERGVKNGP